MPIHFLEYFFNGDQSRTKTISNGKLRKTEKMLHVTIFFTFANRIKIAVNNNYKCNIL